MNLLERWLENPARVARIKRWFYLGLAAIALAEIVLPLLFHGEGSYFWFESVPAWYSIYGLLSCIAIIVVSKLLGKVWLMRREDYYDS